jgi:eukaryotic-like serine/threonine-protein kinase
VRTISEQQLGNYRLLHFLDSGGFADVYLAEHTYLKTLHAVKVLHMSLFDQGEQQRFLDEARLLARLRHPHIIQVQDFGIEYGIPFLVMSYAPGGNLRTRHPEGARVPRETALRYVKQVAAALHYAHDQHLIHRDLKPENVLLDANGEVVLSDFGIAIVARSSHSQSVQDVVGTATYMAPEQLKGRPRPASDQYALATLAYEWLCGVPPFDGPTSFEIAKKHLSAPVPALSEQAPDISPAVEAVLNRALAKEYHQRFESIQAFADALEQASRSNTMPEPAPARQAESEQSLDPPPERPREKRRRSRRFVLAMLGTAGALAAGGSYLGWRALSGAGSLSQRSKHQRVSSPVSTTGKIGRTVFVYGGLSNTGIPSFQLDTLAWSPDGTRILSAGSVAGESAFPIFGKLTVWHASTGAPILTSDTYVGAGNLTYPYGNRKGATWSPDGMRLLATTTTDVTSTSVSFGVHILDAATGKVLLTPPAGSIAQAWSPDGKSIVLLGGYADPNNLPPASQAKDRHIVILDATTGQLILNHDVAAMNTIDPPALWTPGAVDLDVWAPSTRYLASFVNSGVNVWEASKTQLLSRYHGDGSAPQKFALDWSPDEQRIASGWGSAVHISTALTGEHVLTYQGHTQTVRTVAWSPDGSRVASGGEDGTIQIWEAATGKLIATYREHTANVLTLAWSADGSYIVSGSADGMVYIWTAT